MAVRPLTSPIFRSLPPAAETAWRPCETVPCQFTVRLLEVELRHSATVRPGAARLLKLLKY